eukprot:Phypoly_transcript_07367.p1 GENE.Phypoly_transcript_07367~~Phypoly_transcript_07367.p1  ORF type:complete len:361 (+),score=59.75 Phypoly_transcript_07367:91-1173(+)
MFFDYNGTSFVMVDGQINALPQQTYYYPAVTGYTLLPPQSSIPVLASTLGLPQAYDCSTPLTSPVPTAQPAPSPSASPCSEVDQLVDLVSYFNQQEEPSSEASQQVAELASTLQSSLPSSPSQPPDSPLMHRTQLPSISSLSEELHAVKKQYSSSYFSPASSRIPVLPSLSLPSISRSAPSFTKQPEVVSVPSPESDPCASPPLSSPKQRSKKNYTKEFNIRFHDLLNNNEHASNEWHLYAQRHKGKCTIKRAPCIKVSRGFCASYAHEFSDLAKEERYGALGTRTECGCMHKPQPLSSSSGPARKQRQSARITPYPSQQTSSPSTPELPSTEPSSPLVCVPSHTSLSLLSHQLSSVSYV